MGNDRTVVDSNREGFEICTAVVRINSPITVSRKENGTEWYERESKGVRKDPRKCFKDVAIRVEGNNSNTIGGADSEGGGGGRGTRAAPYGVRAGIDVA